MAGPQSIVSAAPSKVDGFSYMWRPYFIIRQVVPAEIVCRPLQRQPCTSRL